MVKTIKINYDGDIRRHAIEEITYDSLVKLVVDAFPDISVDELQMKYEDEEGDMCTLVPLSFTDFLTTQSGNKALKVQVSKKKSTASFSAGHCATDDASQDDALPQKGTTDAEDGRQDGNDRAQSEHGGQSHRQSGDSFKWLQVIKTMKEIGALNPQVFASLFVQWLPLITQKFTTELDAINHAVATASMTSFLLILQYHVETVPALESFAAPLKAILDQEPDAPLLGDTLRSLLTTLQALPFEVQANFVELLSESVFPLLDDLVADLPQEETQPGWMQDSLVHHGVACDHCGASPIVGPRFKCTICPNYDLCGNCFPQKMSIHGPATPDAAPHDFQCMMSPHSPLGKGCKGWGKGYKGSGKGHVLRHVMPFLHGMMGGHGFKGWGKGGKGFKGWGKGGKGENTMHGHPQSHAPPCPAMDAFGQPAATELGNEGSHASSNSS